MEQIIIEGEVFTRLTTHPAYYINATGDVHSPAFKHRGNILKGAFNSVGYRMVWLRDSAGAPKWVTVHRLQALNFIPNPHNYNEINHIDGNKLNNRVENLEWCTHSQNIQHSYDNNHRQRISGANHWCTGRKLTEAQKKALGESKKGAKHPKHIGTFITPWGTFESANQAGKAGNTDGHTVKRRCTSTRFRHLGYNFIPKQSA